MKYNPRVTFSSYNDVIWAICLHIKGGGWVKYLDSTPNLVPLPNVLIYSPNDTSPMHYITHHLSLLLWNWFSEI